MLQTSIRWLVKVLAVFVVLLLILLVTVRLRYGGGESFPDRTTAPLYPFSAMEVVANVDHPPGNIAVSEQGRVFFTLHPEAKPPMNLVEWKDGQAYPYPSASYQPGGDEALAIQETLSIRIDRQQRLWVLDNAVHGTGQPRILAFDLNTDQLVHHYDFPKDVFGLGSHANDFQVSPDGNTIFISDASLFAKTPALVVYDVENRRSIRRLQNHESVVAEHYAPVVQGRKMSLFGGLFTVKPGVDGIALDRNGEWLYYASITGTGLYRIKAALLTDFSMSDQNLRQAVERYADKTMTDGMTTDHAGNVYLSDPEHSALLRITPERKLETLIKDERLRWPDGYSFGPDGYLYITCSSLHHVLDKPDQSRIDNGPYQVFRFKPGVDALAGH